MKISVQVAIQADDDTPTVVLQIVSTYGSEYRGLVQYYLCATKRSVISPAQRAEIGGDISGSDG